MPVKSHPVAPTQQNNTRLRILNSELPRLKICTKENVERAESNEAISTRYFLFNKEITYEVNMPLMAFSIVVEALV